MVITYIKGNIMKRVTIYVDEVVWDDVKEGAYRARVSAGEYLMNAHRAYFPNLAPKGFMQDEIEKVHASGKTIIESFDSDTGKLNKPDPIQKAKLKKVEETISASDKDVFFKPMPKGGKK